MSWRIREEKGDEWTKVWEWSPEDAVRRVGVRLPRKLCLGSTLWGCVCVCVGWGGGFQGSPAVGSGAHQLPETHGGHPGHHLSSS